MPTPNKLKDMDLHTLQRWLESPLLYDPFLRRVLASAVDGSSIEEVVAMLEAWAEWKQGN